VICSVTRASDVCYLFRTNPGNPVSPSFALCPADTAIKLAKAPFLLLEDAVIQFGLGSKLVAAAFSMLLIISCISLAVPVAANDGGEPTAVPTADTTGTAAVNATEAGTKV